MTILSTDTGRWIDFVNTLTTRVKIIPFNRAHLSEMKIQDKQSFIPLDQKSHENLIVKPELCFTMTDDDGEILSCLGVTERDGMGLSWAVNSIYFAGYFREITLIVNNFLMELGKQNLYEKVYGSCLKGWKEGENWLSMLKFSPLESNFTVFGKEFILFERNLI